MSRTCLATQGLLPLAVSVFVCRDIRSASDPSACATKVMRHKVGLGDLVCSACPDQPQRCGDGEDRDLLQQSVAAHSGDVADGTHRRKLHRAFSVHRKTCADASLTWR